MKALPLASAAALFVLAANSASAAGYALQGAPQGLPAGSWGYVFLPAAVGIALASVLTAPWGTRLAHRISGPALRRLFAAFLAVVGTSVWLAP